MDRQMSELKTEHVDMVSDYRNRVVSKTADSYMLTIARDGESPARSIYFYGDAIDAANGYAAYTDWGFAKDFLTIELYEPTGKVHTKVLRRPRGGECTFVRDDYHKTSQILKSVIGRISGESHRYLAMEFAKLFSKDNQRFDSSRFLVELGYEGDLDDKH
jgi:hypothetical protein